MPNIDGPPISNNKPPLTSIDRTQQKTTAYDAGNPVLAWNRNKHLAEINK